MTSTMMKCGCAAVGMLTHRAGLKLDPPIPYCSTHSCDEVATEAPALEGRTSRCTYWAANHNAALGNTKGTHPSEAPSSPDLPFFEHRPTAQHDRHYCGCMGWD